LLGNDIGDLPASSIAVLVVALHSVARADALPVACEQGIRVSALTVRG
jgi:hypothetical protein